MSGSFKQDDVTLLLKDITGQIEPLATAQREKRIQSGTHYSEMLPLEHKPSVSYMHEYEFALEFFSQKTADAVSVVSEKIYKNKGKQAVLVSLARAGTPVGILIKRYIKKKYAVNLSHYTISIIRGKGIDTNALDYILMHHNANEIQFVDGWTGKGAIQNELKNSLLSYPHVDDRLAVLSDPANITSLCGTHEDFLIAYSCLNATVCGLMSRTVLKSGIIGKTDFHGVTFLNEFSGDDRTYEFIDKIESCFNFNVNFDCEVQDKFLGIDEVIHIAEEFDVKDINLIKPGVGETTRVLLRRVPEIILIKDDAPAENVAHIRKLAEEKGITTRLYPLKRYCACGIIKNLSADV